MEFDFGEVGYEGVLEGMYFFFPLLEQGIWDWSGHCLVLMVLVG